MDNHGWLTKKGVTISSAEQPGRIIEWCAEPYEIALEKSIGKILVSHPSGINIGWAHESTIAKNKTLETRMTPKDTYVIIGFTNNGKYDVIFPMKIKNEEPIYSYSPQLSFESVHGMRDMNDVSQYIKENNIAGKYYKVIVSKITDVVQVEIKSLCEEKQ